ncbi:MAG: hypothetical protein RH917_09845 [Lacipirellulaceae bacterium]
MPPRRFEHSSHATNDSEQPYDERNRQPSVVLGVKDQSVKAMLEYLDDVVFAAIRGDEPSIEEARQLWPQIVKALPWQEIEPSREQYLRYAVETSRKIQDTEGSRPESTLAAIEIISLLTR